MTELQRKDVERIAAELRDILMNVVTPSMEQRHLEAAANRLDTLVNTWRNYGKDY